jgi:ATP-grasp domain
MGRVLIIASAYSIGLSRLPKVLARAGYRVTVLGPPGTLAGRSRYTSECVPCGSTKPDLVRALQQHLKISGEYDLILLGDDDSLLAIADYWQEPWVGDWLPFPKTAQAVAMCTDKLEFGKAMLAAGMPYPQSLQGSTLEEISDAVETLQYPAVVKSPHGCMGLSVRIVHNQTELEQAFAKLRNGPLQVQKHIDGRVGLTACLFDRGRLVASAPSFKNECYPDATGASCVREFFTHPKMQGICEQIGRLTQFHGFAGVDWILDHNNDLSVIEFNARPIPGYHFCNVAGVDFSAAAASMLKRETLPPMQPKGGGRVYMYPQHLLRIRDERDWKSLWRYLPFCSKMDLPWDDLHLLIEPFAKKLLRLRPRLRRRTSSSPSISGRTH